MTLYYNVKIWFNLQNYANLTSQTEKKNEKQNGFSKFIEP